MSPTCSGAGCVSWRTGRDVYSAATRPTSPSSVAEKSSVWRSDGVCRDDPVDGGLEAHVEHAVGLVEHEHVDRRRARTARRSIRSIEPARGGDEHVRARGLLGLVVDADAAVDGRDRAGRGRARRRASSSTIWAASSRVGARMSACGQAPSGSTTSTSGTPKASVLPEPVGDLTRTSWPSRTSGTTLAGRRTGVRCRAGRARRPRSRTRRDRRTWWACGSSFSRPRGGRVCGWGDSTDPIRAIGAPSRKQEPHGRHVAVRIVTVAAGNIRSAGHPDHGLPAAPDLRIRSRPS